MSLIKNIVFGTSSHSSPLRATLCLQIISDRPGITAKALALMTGLALSSTYKILFDLEKNSFSQPALPLIKIEITRDKEKSAYITENGLAFLAEEYSPKSLH